MEVFFVWEKLRILVNAQVALVMPPELLSLAPSLVYPAFVMANLLFCAAPVLENYCGLMGVSRHTFRWTMMILITLFFCGLSLRLLWKVAEWLFAGM
jgi:hypothetical protein